MTSILCTKYFMFFFSCLVVLIQVIESPRLGSRLGGSTVGALSPAERSRLQLALVSLQAPEVLLLDQPTHITGATLTYDDVQAIADLITKYPKTCVVNSSDTAFLNNFSDTVLNISPDGSVERFTGSYTSAQNIIAERYRVASDPQVKTMSLKERAGWFALLLPIEVLIFWSMTYAGR
jgi:ABC-type cobalamin/Fe3+-siderophores transport system ATPase subunit